MSKKVKSSDLALYQEVAKDIATTAEERFVKHYEVKEDSYKQMYGDTLLQGVLMAIGKLSKLFFMRNDHGEKMEQIADIFNWLVFLNWRLGESITEENRRARR